MHLFVKYDFVSGAYCFLTRNQSQFLVECEDLYENDYIIVDFDDLAEECDLSQYGDWVAVVVDLEQNYSWTSEDLESFIEERGLAEEDEDEEEMYVDDDDVITINGVKYVRVLEEEDED
jgi:hypothetical protein